MPQEGQRRCPCISQSPVKPVGYKEYYHTGQDEGHKEQCRRRIHADSLTGTQRGGTPLTLRLPKKPYLPPRAST
jgi:hypothetical protein